MRNKQLLVALLTLFSINSYANYTCVGNVNGLSIDPKSGDVLVDQIGTLSWPRLCSIKTEQNGVSPDTCKVVYSTLLSAQMADKQVRLWFNDGKDCSLDSHTEWQFLTGWYFGPRIES